MGRMETAVQSSLPHLTNCRLPVSPLCNLRVHQTHLVCRGSRYHYQWVSTAYIRALLYDTRWLTRHIAQIQPRPVIKFQCCPFHFKLCSRSFNRDWLIGNATSNTTIPTSNLTNSSTFSGHSSAGGYTYQTDVLYVSGLLSNTSEGINHFQSVADDGDNAIDGLVAVMTVKITQQPQRTASASSS